MASPRAVLPRLPTAALLPVLAACGTAPERPVAPEPPREVEGRAWAAVQPDELLWLVQDPSAILGVDPSCPTLDEAPGRQLWSGGCIRQDGAWVAGRVERLELGDATWLVGEGYSVLGAEGTEVLFDGALLRSEQGGLWGLDVAARLCGLHTDCAEGLLGLDLRYSLRSEADGALADVAVRGMLALEGQEPVAVEGAWRQDPARCEVEPVSGLLAVQSDGRRTLELDGARSCDGCAAWTTPGASTAVWCPAAL